MCEELEMPLILSSILHRTRLKLHFKNLFFKTKVSYITLVTLVPANHGRL